jgi:hypothetical protein
LRISITDSGQQRQLLVEGSLIAPWIADLKATYERAKAGLCGRLLRIHLCNITAISQEGENVLLRLIDDGAEIRCSGGFTQHLVVELARHRLCKEAAETDYGPSMQLVGGNTRRR